jgi:malonyl-CoA decarboxylase
LSALLPSNGSIMNEHVPASLLDRALRNLRHAWHSIAGTAYDAQAASLRPDLPQEDVAQLRAQMRACLEPRGGEVSARTRAAALGHVYLALDKTGRHRFLKVLAEDFDVDPATAAHAAQALLAASDADARREAAQALRDALEAPRTRLLTQFNGLPDGVKFLVDMRAELIPLARTDPALRALERDLRNLLASWFDVGFLELRRLTWDNAPAALLERLIAYEAVHAIESWDDLKNRLDSDRRCFAFFHPKMPNEPLIFVEVALVNGMADNVQTLLDEKAPVLDPRLADTAIFYSISNAQKGLAGISFGNFLIKRVVDSLSNEFKGLKTFATLSPAPGFRAWLERTLAEGDPTLLLPAERKAISAASGRARGAKGMLKALLAEGTWPKEPALAAALRAPLLRLCVRYLAQEKAADGRRALDPVAHFHLSNGARLERLNWMADLSEKGLEQSAGIMVNYLYKLSEIDDNHEAYSGAGEVAMSSTVKGLLKG